LLAWLAWLAWLAGLAGLAGGERAASVAGRSTYRPVGLGQARLRRQPSSQRSM
jgi:hypothetical protein